MDCIGMIGTSYRRTGTETLARAAFPAAPETGTLAALARLAGFEEMVHLGTCNRVEFYFRTAAPADTRDLLFHLRRSLADLTDGRSQLPDDEALTILRGEEAIRHLFRVTAALDSMMVGEAQIAGQVKAAHELAHEAGLLGGPLDQAFHEAFHLAKRVRTETELARRPVSLVTLVERLLGEHLAGTSTPVLVLGAGEMATEAVRLVRRTDAGRRILVANRTPDRAEALARAATGVHVLPLDAVLADPPAVGTLIAATAADTVLLGSAGVEAVRRRIPSDEGLLLVDLAMPPNLDPASDSLDGVRYVGIESLRAEAEANRRARLAEIDRCEALIDHQLTIFRRRLVDRALSPVARSLHGTYTGIAAATLERTFARELAHLGPEDRDAVQRYTEYLLKRLVQVPLRGLKGAATDHGLAVIEAFGRQLEEASR